MAYQPSSGSQGFGERPRQGDSSNAGSDRPQEPHTGDPPSSAHVPAHLAPRNVGQGIRPGGRPLSGHVPAHLVPGRSGQGLRPGERFPRLEFPAAADYYGDNSPRLRRPGSVPASAKSSSPRAILSSSERPQEPNLPAMAPGYHSQGVGRGVRFPRLGLGGSPASSGSEVPRGRLPVGGSSFGLDRMRATSRTGGDTSNRMPSSTAPRYQPAAIHRGGRLQEQRRWPPSIGQAHNDATAKDYNALKRKRLGENIKPPSTHPWAIAHKKRLDTAASEEATCYSLQSDCKVSECVQRQSRSALATSSTLNAKSRTAVGGTAIQSDASDNCCAPTLDLTNGDGRRRGNAARQCQVHRNG